MVLRPLQKPACQELRAECSSIHHDWLSVDILLSSGVMTVGMGEACPMGEWKVVHRRGSLESLILSRTFPIIEVSADGR